MRSIGLTGGIASGKSTVTKTLAEQGAVIIDADLLGHETYEPGTDTFRKVVDAFAKHGKHPGLGGVYDEVNAPKFVERGMRFILSGGDLPIFMAGANARSQFLRGLQV